MFTGIVETVGTIRALENTPEGALIKIETPTDFKVIELGESIAVNGTCLTAILILDRGFSANLSSETLKKTSLSEIKISTLVNLERSLTPLTKMSGHFVLGHVDEVGTIVEIKKEEGQTLFRFKHSENMVLYIVEKGSIAIDGISLTVFDCRDNCFSVSVIPFTLIHTNLFERKMGDKVNLECDMIGKYVVKACENFLGGKPSGNSSITPEFLKRYGYE
jgi:riboflavin synthase